MHSDRSMPPGQQHTELHHDRQYLCLFGKIAANSSGKMVDPNEEEYHCKSNKSSILHNPSKMWQRSQPKVNVVSSLFCSNFCSFKYKSIKDISFIGKLIRYILSVQYIIIGIYSFEFIAFFIIRMCVVHCTMYN